MYISDVSNKEELQNNIIQILRDVGIKYKLKKSASSKTCQLPKHGKFQAIFKVKLENLTCDTVLLNSGVALDIPSFVLDACCNIRQNVTTEGIFRKAGSTARQKEIKVSLDSGKNLGPSHHVIDVANLLKQFFRELPEPLIPYVFHDLMLRCLLVKDKMLESIMLICLLLPQIHLNTIAYLMEFLKEVASYSENNRMDTNNLAIVLTPSLMPVGDKNMMQSGVRLSHHVQIVKLLIENADRIGTLPESLCDKLSLSVTSEDTSDSGGHTRRKTKRSGSLTRMLNGFKKMVGKATPDLEEHRHMSPITEFATPRIKSNKKRKLTETTSAFSNKKKIEVLNSLPQTMTLADVPFTPSFNPKQLCFSPVSSNISMNASSRAKSVDKLKQRKFLSPKTGEKKVTRWSSDRVSSNPNSNGHSNQDLHKLLSTDAKKRRSSSLERQWLRNFWNKKKSCSELEIPDLLHHIDSTDDISGVSIICDDVTSVKEAADGVINCNHVNSKSDEPSFVCISKCEYEEIKKRVSAIESRISQEFDNLIQDSLPDEMSNIQRKRNSIEHVQTEYEKTVEESEKISNITPDLLARQFKNGLKIRRSADSKVIRSPSARKIGTIRRKSQENMKPDRKSLYRNKSWHLSTHKFPSQRTFAEDDCFYRRHTLKRGRPNTVHTGLPLRSASTANVNAVSCEQTSTVPVNQKSCNISELKSVLLPPDSAETDACFSEVIYTQSPESFKELELSEGIQENFHVLSQENPAHNTADYIEWQSAKEFFTRKNHLTDDLQVTGRPSLVKLRNENAGLVLARTRMFDSTTSESNQSNPSHTKVHLSSSSNMLITQNSYLGNRHAEPQVLRFARDQEIRGRKTGISTGRKISPKKKLLQKSNSKSPIKMKQSAKLTKSVSLKEERRKMAVADSKVRKYNSMNLKNSKTSSAQILEFKENFKVDTKNGQLQKPMHISGTPYVKKNDRLCLPPPPLKDYNRISGGGASSSSEVNVKESLQNYSYPHNKLVKQNIVKRRNYTPV